MLSTRELSSDYNKNFQDMHEKTRTIMVILGHPGSGKGTFAQALNDQHILHISLGDYLRDQFRNKTDIGTRWKAEVERDGILAVNVVQEVTDNLLRSVSESPPQTYILDGHVRLLKQAIHLEELLTKSQNISPVFVYIDTAKEECLRRIPHRRTCEKCHRIYNLITSPPKKKDECDVCEETLTRRDTDNETQGRNRIDTYASHLEEVVNYYREKGSLIEFDGSLPIEACIEAYRKAFVN
jgi:adenylate kinase